MRPKGKLLELQNQFVRLRIVNMATVDVGLFDFDFDVTFALFVLNHEKNIYLRYGGRTDESPDAFLSEKSLIKTLQQGLSLHGDYKKGSKFPPPPKSVPVNSYPHLDKLIKKGECIHCHQIAEAQARQRMALPDFDKKQDVWVYPNPATLGLLLDPDQGTQLKGASGAAAQAGLKDGDTITAIDQKAVQTYGDLQHALHHIPKNTSSLSLSVQREDKTESVDLSLPDHWRVTDINRRSVGHRLTPFPGFWAKTLKPEERKGHGFAADGFASEVTKFWVNTNGKKAGMKKGDIAYAINGVEKSPLARNIAIYIRLHFEPGDEIRVSYLRNGKKGEATFNLKAKPW